MASIGGVSRTSLSDAFPAPREGDPRIDELGPLQTFVSRPGCCAAALKSGHQSKAQLCREMKFGRSGRGRRSRPFRLTVAMDHRRDRSKVTLVDPLDSSLIFVPVCATGTGDPFGAKKCLPHLATAIGVFRTFRKIPRI